MYGIVEYVSVSRNIYISQTTKQIHTHTQHLWRCHSMVECVLYHTAQYCKERGLCAAYKKNEETDGYDMKDVSLHSTYNQRKLT